LRINDISKMPCLRGFARFAYTALFALSAPKGVPYRLIRP
jgi:hypothetical protein